MLPFYVELESSTPADAGGPTPIPLPDLDDGPHLSYAFQWFIFATLAVIGWVVVVRKSGRDHKQSAHDKPNVSVSTRGSDSTTTRRRLGPMALTDEALSPAPDDVEEVAWNLESLVDGNGAAGVDELLDRAETMLPPLLEQRDHVATMDAATLAAFMSSLSDLQELIGKAASYAGLKFAVDTSDPANGALMQRVQERATAIGTQLIWFELEWAAIPDEAADTILADDRIAPYRYHLESRRRYRPHLLTEPEERIVAEKSVTGALRMGPPVQRALGRDHRHVARRRRGAARDAAWRCSCIPIATRDATAAEAITAGLAPGLRTRAFIFNTLLADKSTDDRLRSYPTWITSRNLANQASDESVEALVDAVKRRYDIPQRWYTMKRKILGLRPPRRLRPIRVGRRERDPRRVG